MAKIKERRYYPMIISEKGTEEKMSSAEDLIVWNKFDRLSLEKQNILLSYEMLQKLQELQSIFSLGDKTIGQVTLMIRQIFFGELSLTECEAKIGAMLTESGGGDPNQARAIVEFIQKEILTIQPKSRVETAEAEYEEEKLKVTTVNLPLLQALSKYEQLGQQVITSGKIKLKTQIEPVRPSIINWLKYYRDELGIGQHSNVERGEFLFRSENGRKLSGEERERISLILKSVEEYLPIMIDTERQEIIFPAFTSLKPLMAKAGFAETPVGKPVFQGSQAFPSIAPNSQGRNAYFEKPKPTPTKSSAPGSVSFSAGHIFPSEKESSEKGTNVVKKTTPQQNPFHIRPMTNNE